MRIFAALAETAHQLAVTWEPTNDDGQIAAQEMRVLVRELPEVLEELAQAVHTMAGKCTDGIWMDSGAADALHGLAVYLRGPIPSLQDAARTIDAPHGDDIERIHREDPRAQAWDWSRNQGYTV